LTICNPDTNEQLQPDDDYILYFKQTHNILFEALEAKFGLMPSATRIVEQKHGQLRDCLRLGVGHDFTDTQQQYVTNEDYISRERRREYERKRKANQKLMVSRRSKRCQRVIEAHGMMIRRNYNTN